MICIPNTDFTSDIELARILYSTTKEKLFKIANRLDLYVSPNIAKDKMARRLADEILSNPIEVVSRLSRTELLLLEEFINAGPNKYVVKKIRKSEYMLQKWGLVLTHEDMDNNQWHLLMPDEVREALAPESTAYIALAKEGKKGPSAKELRMASFMADFLGHTDFTIKGNTIINHRPKKS